MDVEKYIYKFMQIKIVNETTKDNKTTFMEIIILDSPYICEEAKKNKEFFEKEYPGLNGNMTHAKEIKMEYCDKIMNKYCSFEHKHHG